MNIVRLAFREIRYRKFGFALALLGVAGATACLVAQVLQLRQHDRQTEALVAARDVETRNRMAKLEDDYRKITKGLGFNVLILPKDQNLGDHYAEDYATKFMPEQYVEKLSRSRLVTIQHLLPSLQQKVKWPEKDQRTIIVMGVRGEVPIAGSDSKQPILQPVLAGSMVVGYELHRQYKLAIGDSLTLMGRRFVVSKLREARGTKDDITVWINLPEAQEILDRHGLINGIYALECVCAADSLDKIRAEIAKILPDTQVIEYVSQTLARAEARQRAAAEAKAAIEQERRSRASLRAAKENYAAVLVPMSVLGAALWVALLAFGNARDRRPEIGILRALGVRGRQVLALLLARSVLIGVVGAAIGCGLGAMIVRQNIFVHETWWLPAGALLAAPLLSVAASWIPSLWAIRSDPAGMLTEV